MHRVQVAAVICLFGFVSNAQAAECALPTGFVAAPRPSVEPIDRLVTHTEEIDIDRPLATVVELTNRTSLEHTIRKGSSLPGVAGTHDLSEATFGTPGARRLVCLTDGSTTVEEVLEREQSASSYHFRYVVWNYTSPQARPIAYGVGDFQFTQSVLGRTHIYWSYSFQLNRNRFPGYLGDLGNFFFRVGFLDRQYADLMRGVLQGYKAAADAS